MAQDKNGTGLALGDMVTLTATVEQFHDEGSIFLRTVDGDLRINVWGKCVQKIEAEINKLETEVAKGVKTGEELLEKVKEEVKAGAAKVKKVV